MRTCRRPPLGGFDRTGQVGRMRGFGSEGGSVTRESVDDGLGHRSNCHALEHRDRIRRAARTAGHLEGQPHEHELVAVFFSTRLRDGLE